MSAIASGAPTPERDSPTTHEDRVYSEAALHAEIESLRRGLLLAFLIALPLIGWAWYARVVFDGWDLRLNSVPMVLLTLAPYIAFHLNRRDYYALACWTILLAMVVSLSAVILGHPQSMALAYGVIIAASAAALLDTRGALVALVVTFVTGAATQWIARPSGEDITARLVEAGFLYALLFATLWVGRRPLRTAVEWALEGWDQAHQALQETRARRGELYRTVRALEEATYRIQRMNNELIVARREAEVARVLKARFAATVSHELRAPLNLILGFSSMMVLSPEHYGEPLPDAYLADVDTIYRSSQHLATLVDDILDLSQIEAERLPLVKDRIDLNRDVVQTAIETMRPMAERKGLYLRTDLASDLPWIIADPVRLRQVLVNLLNNAIRFTERGGITVRTIQREQSVEVHVRDTGPGIAPEDHPRLFQEFHRLELTDTLDEAGTGLGLAISKHLVELHDGDIWVESERGAGSTFSFSVPLPGTTPVESEVESSARQDTGPVRYRQQTPICLVVHNEPSFIRLLSRFLEGYRVVGAPDVERAVETVAQLHPRAILTRPEVVPPLHDWLDAQGFGVPIIACAMPRLQDQERFRQVTGYLVKPIMPDVLQTTMRRLERDGETHVLLVDDEPDAVRLMQRMLLALPRPYRISRAFDGLQALQVMQEDPPDVAFVDLKMSGMDGEALLGRMKEDERLADVPVVIVSGRDPIHNRVVLGETLTVHAGRPIEISAGAHSLQTLLDALEVDYLEPTEAPAPDMVGETD